MNRWFCSIALVSLLLALAACAKNVLLQDLDQKDANEVLVVLAKNGITAAQEKVEKQQETSWKIIISPGDEGRARELLVANHLPRQKELGLSGVCKEAGLIPTPKTEKCRELLALKGEIINSLETLPGVVNADVVLNIPEKEDFPDANTPEKRPTASVVVEVAAEPAIQEVITESKIQQFVANAVTGMDLRDVSVIISRTGGATTGVLSKEGPEGEGSRVSPTQPLDSSDPGGEELVSVGGLKMDFGSAKKFKIIAVVSLIFFLILSVALISILIKMARGRQGGPFSTNLALPEKAQMDQLVEEAGKSDAQKRGA